MTNSLPGEPLDQLVQRCNEYLGNGGFFNPELMNHRGVSQLVLDLRDFLSAERLRLRLQETHEGTAALHDGSVGAAGADRGAAVPADALNAGLRLRREPEPSLLTSWRWQDEALQRIAEAVGITVEPLVPMDIAEAVQKERDLHYCAVKALTAALKGILAEPYGCSLCDSGTPRNPEKGHQPCCPYELAKQVLRDVEGLRREPQPCKTCSGRGWISKSDTRELGKLPDGSRVGAAGAWNEACPDCPSIPPAGRAPQQEHHGK